jgi:hypothetical protein
MKTSRRQLDRPLDPDNGSVMLAARGERGGKEFTGGVGLMFPTEN